MKRSLLAIFMTVGMLTGGFVILGDSGAARIQGDVVEEWVNANLMRVHVDGKWQEVPLVPLADHLCRNPHRLFQKHCGDEVLAPQPQ